MPAPRTWTGISFLSSLLYTPAVVPPTFGSSCCPSPFVMSPRPPPPISPPFTRNGCCDFGAVSYDATEVSPRNEIDTEETSPFLNPVLLSLFDEPGRCGGLSRPPGRAPVPLGFRHGTVLWAWALACDGSHHPHPPWGSLAPALLHRLQLLSLVFVCHRFSSLSKM